MKPRLIVLPAWTFARAVAADQCPTGDGIGMIVARGTNEPVGVGSIGNVSSTVAGQLTGSVILPVDYPAVLDDYPSSVAQGVAATTKMIRDFNANCPGKNLVLFGYSQGAQVMADVLCGTSELGFTPTAPVAGINNLTAVILFGDPTRITGLSWDRGTATKNGIFPRKNLTACEPYTDVMLSYCNFNDAVCDSGTSLIVHGGYDLIDGANATDFVVSQVASAMAAANATTNSTTNSTTTGGSNSASGIATRFSGTWLFGGIFLCMYLYL